MIKVARLQCTRGWWMGGKVTIQIQPWIQFRGTLQLPSI